MLEITKEAQLLLTSGERTQEVIAEVDRALETKRFTRMMVSYIEDLNPQVMKELAIPTLVRRLRRANATLAAYPYIASQRVELLAELRRAT